MATRNDVTGDELRSRGNTDAYSDGYDRIWGKKNATKAVGQGVPSAPEVGGRVEPESSATQDGSGLAQD